MSAVEAGETERSAYQEMVRRARRIVRKSVPPDAVVAVVSKGDRALLKLDDRRAWHFPQRADGVYAGHYPADGAAAIAHLETLRQKGAQFLMFPSTALWWLDHYTEFKDHLDAHHQLLVRDDETCIIYRLAEPRMTERLAGTTDSGNTASKVDNRTRRAPQSLVRSAANYIEDRLVEDLAALFDRDHYRDQSGIEFASADEALVHYLETGFLGGLDPHPLFHTTYYLHRYPAARISGANPLLHFLRHGVAEGHDPNPYFDTMYYYSQGPGLRDHKVNALVHYIRNAKSGSSYNPNPLFVNRYYLRASPDATARGSTPLAHYLKVGWREGRFISLTHQNLSDVLQKSSRSSLLRGNWKNGTVLLFSYGGRTGSSVLMPQLADVLATDYHLDSNVVTFKPPAYRGSGDHARLLVLDDFQSACEIFRPSALRQLTKALLSSDPVLVISEVHEIMGLLHADRRPAYFLLQSAESVPRDVLSQIFDQVERVVFSSSEEFHAVAKKLGRYPQNVTLQEPMASQRGRARDDSGTSNRGSSPEQYVRSLLDLAGRDFGIETAPTQRPESRSGRSARTVIIPCSDWAVSGVNVSLQAVGKQLIDLGWNVEILFTRDQAFVQESGGGGVHLPEIPYRFLKRAKRGLAGMWEALIADVESHSPCIFFMGYDFLANSAAAALTDPVGVVTWVQADDGDYYEQVYRLGRYCNAIVCVSECIRDRVRVLNPALADRAHVIYNSSVREGEVARRKRRNTDRLKIIYCGRLVQYQKRVMDFIELAAALDETSLPYTITLIGQFSPREDVMDLFHARGERHLEDGRIVLPGRMTRSELLEQLSQHDFFVLLSDFEGLPLSVVEAMARGCVPVVAGTDSGIPEIVTDAENGLIVGERDYRKWAELLADHWSDRTRYSRMSQNARKAVRERLTVEQVGRKFDELFRHITEEITIGRFQRPPALHWGEKRSLTGDVLPPPSMFRPVSVIGLR